MAVDEIHDVSEQNPQLDRSDDPESTAGKLFSWWYVWIPIIVAVTLWIGGWWFGDYGGPWGPKPQSVQPQISDPIVVIDGSRQNPTVASRTAHQRHPAQPDR
jgi:heme A synthase